MANEFVKPDDVISEACKDENTNSMEGFEACATPFFPENSMDNPLFNDLYDCLLGCTDAAKMPFFGSLMLLTVLI